MLVTHDRYHEVPPSGKLTTIDPIIVLFPQAVFYPIMQTAQSFDFIINRGGTAVKKYYFTLFNDERRLTSHVLEKILKGEINIKQGEKVQFIINKSITCFYHKDLGIIGNREHLNFYRFLKIALFHGAEVSFSLENIVKESNKYSIVFKHVAKIKHANTDLIESINANDKSINEDNFYQDISLETIDNDYNRLVKYGIHPKGYYYVTLAKKYIEEGNTQKAIDLLYLYIERRNALQKSLREFKIYMPQLRPGNAVLTMLNELLQRNEYVNTALHKEVQDIINKQKYDIYNYLYSRATIQRNTLDKLHRAGYLDATRISTTSDKELLKVVTKLTLAKIREFYPFSS
jgi:hypothetical protein